MACLICVRLPFWLDAFSAWSRPLRTARAIQRSPSLGLLYGFGCVAFLSVALAYVGGGGCKATAQRGNAFGSEMTNAME
jgi:hypothetical protein